MIRWLLSLLDPELREMRDQRVHDAELIAAQKTLIEDQRSAIDDLHSLYRHRDAQARMHQDQNRRLLVALAAEKDAVAHWRQLAEGRVMG